MTFISFGEFYVPHTHSPRLILTALRCGGCHGGYFIETQCHTSDMPHANEGNIQNNKYITIIKEYPRAQEVTSPLHLPENVKTLFLQASKTLKSGNIDSSAMTSRKVLEISVKQLNPNGSGSLYNRIEELHKNGKITDDLKEWAHIIRDDGNTATHEDKPITKAAAEELLSFCELFLMYTFTMPKMVALKKSS